MKKIQTTVDGKLQEKDRIRLARKFSNESNNIPIVHIDGYDLIVSGGYHWFRWLGRFKSYPGSYQPSTRQINLGKNWGNGIKLPKGCSFYWDSLGFCVVRNSDKMEYHPTRRECGSLNFVSLVRKGLSDNYKKRLEFSRKNKEMLSYKKLFDRESLSTRVTLHDSIKAGNCIEGSLKFAEKYFGLIRSEIIDGGYLFSISGKKLIKLVTKEQNVQLILHFNVKH